MYRKVTMRPTSLRINKGIEGEMIEHKIQRILNNGEPIEDGAPIIYTERKDGVGAAYNPRTDRFEVAVEAMDAVAKAETAKREDRMKQREAKMKKIEGGEGAGEPDNGTSGGE